MQKIALVLGVGLALLVAGCSNSNQRVVGIWKGQIIPPSSEKKSDDLGGQIGDAFKGFINGFLGPMVIEFNADGKYKISMNLGSETGTYSVNGNEITLVPDARDPNAKMKFNAGKLLLSDDGKSIHNKKEFSTDSDFELKKQDPSAK